MGLFLCECQPLCDECLLWLPCPTDFSFGSLARIAASKSCLGPMFSHEPHGLLSSYMQYKVPLRAVCVPGAQRFLCTGNSGMNGTPSGCSLFGACFGSHGFCMCLLSGCCLGLGEGSYRILLVATSCLCSGVGCVGCSALYLLCLGDMVRSWLGSCVMPPPIPVEQLGYRICLVVSCTRSS